jgi:hypothetical protein
MSSMQVVFAALALASSALAGCGGGDAGSKGEGPAERADAPRFELSRSEPIDCRAGSEPDYFVPGGPGVLVGCVRLGESGKRVEFSVHMDELREGPLTCINPAYWGRGQRGLFIPTVCPFTPIKRELHLSDVRVPSQGTPGYERVIWGTIGSRRGDVRVSYRRQRVDAVMIDVDQRLARKAEAGLPFRIFVVELPRETACARGAAEGGGRSEAIPPRPRICREAALAAG